jgi:hypothetical protein
MFLSDVRLTTRFGLGAATAALIGFMMLSCGSERIRRLESENQTLTDSVVSLAQELATLQETPENYYAHGIDLITSQRYAEACSAFIALTQKYPTSSLVKNAKEQLANAAKQQARVAADANAEERRRQDEKMYEPLPDTAVFRQWSEFRNHESECKGVVTTWKFEVSDVLSSGCLMGYACCSASSSDYIVIILADENTVSVKAHDRITVTGKFVYVSRDGYVVLAPIRIKNEGSGL